MSDPILRVDDLGVRSGTGSLLRDVSFQLAAGQRLGLIGESGSGKSLTALAIMGLLPDGLTAHGSIRLDGSQVVGAAERDLVGMRGRVASVVFQEPLTALDPLMRLGRQLAEPIQRYRSLSRGDLREAVTDALLEVGLDDADRIARSYPHEVSGGQRQRVAIAMALATRPQLLIADEPTTALDVTVQAGILELLDRVISERGMSLLFISHDLAVVSRVADRVVLLRHGEVADRGSLAELIARPQHPYTRELVAGARELDGAIDHPGGLA